MKAFIFALTLAVLAGCAPATSTSAPGASDSPESMHYTGRVDFDPAAGSLAADLQVHLPVAPNETELRFLLNGALELAAVSGEGVTGFEVEPMAPGAEWDQVAVSLVSESSSRWIDLRFVYSGSPIMPENGINQISENWVELSIDAAWHPVISTIDRDFTTAIELGLPTDWSVVSSGTPSPLEDGFLLTNEIRQIDIAFVAAPGFEQLQGDGFSVYHQGTDTAAAGAVLTSAVACRSLLDRRFGSTKRLPEGRFVITDRSEGGYARKNFIALTEVSDQDDTRLTAFLCHELAHFWSSGAKPLTVDNWLNEGFAVFVAAQAARELFGDATWERALADWRERAAGQPSIWAPDNLERRPFEVNYKKAPLALARLEQEIGGDSFDRLLVRYMTDPIDDTPTLLEALESEAGSQARAWFEALLAEEDSGSGVPESQTEP